MNCLNYFLNYFKILETIPTPAIIWSEKILLDNIKLFKSALENQETEIRYAVKACTLKFVLETVIAEGCSVDCQSVMEAELSLKAGIDYQKITLNSPRLTKEEISWAKVIYFG